MFKAGTFTAYLFVVWGGGGQGLTWYRGYLAALSARWMERLCWFADWLLTRGAAVVPSPPLDEQSEEHG